MITIITVCLNDKLNLEKTLLSFLDQKNNNFEHHVIDGGSTDGTIDLIKRYKNNISSWVSEPDKGIYDAMNKGLERANGEWIHFMNTGDVFINEDILKEIFSRDLSGVDVIYGDSIANYINFMVYKKAGNPDDLWKGMNIRHQAMFVRTSLMKEKFNLDYSLGADYDSLFKMYKQKKNFLYIPKPFVFFDPYGISNTKILQVTREHHRISKKYTKYTLAMYFSYMRRLAYISLINLTRILLPSKAYLKLLKFINRKNLVTIS